jgi:hypothetical protein
VQQVYNVGIEFKRFFQGFERSSMHRFPAAISFVLLLSGLAAAAQSAPGAARLQPAPREASFQGEIALPPTVSRLVIVPGRDAEDEFAARDLEAALETAPHNKTSTYTIRLLRAGSAEGKTVLAAHKLTFDAAMHDEGYVLAIDPQGAAVVAETSVGVFYGVQTLKQLLPLAGEKSVLPAGTVRDWPAMKYRGIDDDLSRGPFPTLEFQKHQIRVFASFKINLYSPYFEHTLLYPNQPLAAPAGSSLTPAEVAELVKYAAQYHIDIVPDQEAFGHLHHVLKYEIYKDVAETPHGHVLAPGQPGSLPLIKDWFAQIAAEFPSPFLHIGADETFDLGIGRTRPAVQQRGYGPVYVDFLKQIHTELKPLNRKILFWGDIGWDDPKAVPGLPKDMIAIPWNYSDKEDWAKMIKPFADAGMETWVAPGDSNWNEVYPKARVAFANIQGFVREGQRLGSTGMINTVWNDDGEGLFNADWYTVLFGAAASWQPGESAIAPWQQNFGALFHGDASGKVSEALREVMSAWEAIDKADTNMTSDELFWLDPWSAMGQQASAKLLPVASDLRLHAEKAMVLLAQARAANPALREQDALTALDLGARRLDFIGMKFQLAREITDAYTEAGRRPRGEKFDNETTNMLYEISSNNGRCQDLRDAYSALRDEFVQVWRSENRPYWLNNVTVRYDLATQLWQQRGDLFHAAIAGFYANRPLPPLESYGVAPAFPAQPEPAAK